MTDELHYYCSSKVLLSILEKRELWLTALGLSNDRLEGKWALTKYLDLFKREDRERQMGARFDIERAIRDRVALGMCLSEERDLLSQWRGYANNGRGVCVTFRTETLCEAIHAAEKDVPGLRLAKVSYEHTLERGLPKDIYDTFREGIEGFSLGSDGIGSLSRTFTPEQHDKETEVVAALYKHKNPAFSEEAEWRLFVVQFPSRLPKFDYREDRNLLSPYLRLSIELSAIKMITLGPQHPTPPMDIENLLKSFECEAPVWTSRTSYLER